MIAHRHHDIRNFQASTEDTGPTTADTGLACDEIYAFYGFHGLAYRTSCIQIIARPVVEVQHGSAAWLTYRRFFTPVHQLVLES